MENQAKVWDEIALKWNDFREVPSPSIVEFLKDKEGKILDLGCGSGRNFSAINKEAELYAVDFSQEMLKYARERAEKLKLNSNIEQSRVDKLPFKDGLFDSVICVAVLHCIPEKKERQGAIREIYRVLKKNGMAFISVWGKNSPRLKNKSKECFVSWTVKSSKKFREGEQGVKKERYTYIYDLEELKKEVLDAGFKVENIWEERNVNVIVRK